MRRQKGFTVIELMVTLTILSVIVSIAVSTYNKYTMRARIVEAVGLLKFYAATYEEYFSLNNNTLPILMTEIMLAAPNTKNVSQIWAGSSSSQGTGMYLYAILSSNLNFGTNNRIMLGLVKSGNTLTVVCGQWQTTLYVPLQYLPPNCNTTGLAGYPGMVN